MGLRSSALADSCPRGNRWTLLRGQMERQWAHNISATLTAGTTEIQKNILYDADLVYREPRDQVMDLTYTDEQRLLSESARTFPRSALSDNCCPASPRPRDRVLCKDCGRALVRGGRASACLHGMVVVVEMCLISLYLPRSSAISVPSPLLTSYALGALPLLWQGSALQRQRWLPSLASGAAIATLALTEPGARHERAPSSLGGKRTAGGWRLDGTKILVPYAPNADLMLVAATLETRGLSLLALDTQHGGVSCERHHSINCESLFAVTFDGVEVLPNDILAGPAQSPRTTLKGARLSMMLRSCILPSTLAWRNGRSKCRWSTPRSREQFGRPIGSFQAVAHRCVDMRLDIDACRVLTLNTACSILGSTEYADTEISAAKSYANGALRRIFTHAHQIHGAIGYF